MKILAFSDSHGRSELMHYTISILRDEIDMVLFLGDCVDDFIDLQYIFPEKYFYFVSGNCDFHHYEPTDSIITALGKKIYITHGHNYGVKLGQRNIVNAAKKKGADVCLYGHSHAPKAFLKQGIYFMNPGSISLPRDTRYPTYGIIDIEEDKISLRIILVKDNGFSPHIILD